MARVQSRAADTRTLLIACLTVTPFLLILLWLGSDAAALREHLVPVTVGVLVYLALLMLRLLQAAYGLLRWRTVLVSLLLLIASPFVFGFLNLDTRLWVAEEPAQAQTDEDQAETEALFYDQPARIETAVERVRLTNPGKAGVYFVGFAGDGNPALFRREAQFASEVFGERFGSADRQVLLINDVEDHDSYPLASVTGLGQTLKLLAARMDPENDVLVLFSPRTARRKGSRYRTARCRSRSSVPRTCARRSTTPASAGGSSWCPPATRGCSSTSSRATPRRSSPPRTPGTAPSAARTTAT